MSRTLGGLVFFWNTLFQQLLRFCNPAKTAQTTHLNVSCLCRQTRLFQRGPGWSWMVGWWDAGGTWYEACEVVRTNNFSKHIVDLCPYCSPLKCCSSWYLVVSHFFQGGRLSRIGGTIGNMQRVHVGRQTFCILLQVTILQRRQRWKKATFLGLCNLKELKAFCTPQRRAGTERTCPKRGKEKSSTHHLFLGLHFGGI